ncbi:hypothetical protein ACC677_36975, partial [Rhizobium ruizarguesonis]
GDDAADILLLCRIVVGSGMVSGYRHRPCLVTVMQDAMRQFDVARNSGAKLIDIGCMQINHYLHGENFRSAEEMFDPHRNVEYAEKFLRNLHDR